MLDIKAILIDFFFSESLKKDVNLETMLAVLQTTCAQTEEESEVILSGIFYAEFRTAVASPLSRHLP